MCAIAQKETKVVQKSLAYLPGKVKDTVAANSLNTKKWEACSNEKKRNTYKNGKSNVKRKFKDSNQKGQSENLAKRAQSDSKSRKPARELVGMFGIKSLYQVIKPYIRRSINPLFQT